MNEFILRSYLFVADTFLSFVANSGSNSKKLLRKNNVLTAIILLIGLFCFTGCSRESKPDNTKTLVDINDVIDTSIMKAGSGVKISLIKTDNGNAIKMECGDKNPVPSVVFREGNKKWALLNYKYVAVDVTNLGKNDLMVESRLAGNAWFSGGQIIREGITRTIRVYIQRINEYPSYLDKKFIGMDALPGGIIKSFWWTAMHPDSMHDISIMVVDPSPNTTILISNIRGEGSINSPSEAKLNDNYFPIIDEFGQLRHTEWPGKIHSLDELIKSKEIEVKDIKANPLPDDWDKYGGWLKGPQLKATGHFRTEKVNGKWWFVDPEGHLFWSNGMGTVGFGDATPITDRENYFTNLPDSNKFKEFYSTIRGSIPKGYYKGVRTIRTFSNLGWNLFRKYGENWKNEYEQLTRSRLRSWGMNSIGNWSDADIIRLSKMPYTGTLGTDGARRIEGSAGPWYKFPDPFDASFRNALKTGLKRIEKSEMDPYCMGYFVDNEFYWGNDSYLAKAVIQSGKNQPAKMEMRKYLEKKYKTINELNSKWQTTYKNWDDFMENTSLPVPEPPLVFGSSTTSTISPEAKNNLNNLKSYIEDTKVFSTIIAKEYFITIKETLAKLAPQSLYLGCKFDFVYYPTEDTSGNWIVKIAAKYGDAISLDRYRYTNSDLKSADIDKPIIIGEWSMGAMDRGLLHYGLRLAESQENRAEMYEYYVKSSLQNPNVVGVFWFEYLDEPVLGREDGEDYNMGFLDVCDIPYPEMVSASRKIGKEMYTIRYSR